MSCEILGLLDVDTFAAVQEQQSVGNVIDSKWMFALEKDELGHVVKFKARLVTPGLKHIEGIDFNETRAPTVSGACVRLLTTNECVLNLNSSFWFTARVCSVQLERGCSHANATGP